MTETQGYRLDQSRWDDVVRGLREALPSWVSLPLADRIDLLRRLRRNVGSEGPGLVEATAQAQGFDPDGPWGAEPWLLLFGMVQTTRALEAALTAVQSGKPVIPPQAITERDDGRVAVRVYPRTRIERLLFPGMTGEVWVAPGVTAAEVARSAGGAHTAGGFTDPGVALLLGAGNVIGLTHTDLLNLLFSRGCTVAVKMNPVLAYQQPAMERIFADFVESGWVSFVDSDLEVGRYLAEHAGVDRLHMTGSALTYDTIRWGPGAEGARRRSEGRPLLDKPFSAELGGVSPTIVVPGRWSDRSLRRQAAQIVGEKLFNCGAVCCSPQVLVLPEGWPGSDRLLAEVARLLREVGPRRRYYPGSDAKVDAVLDRHPEAEVHNPPTQRVVVPVDQDDAFLQQEVFSDVLGVLRLSAPTLDYYLASAVETANDRLAGTLAADLIVDPATHRENHRAVEDAVSGLRYGAVGVNYWAVASANLGYTTWGAYPSRDPRAPSTGSGVVGNALGLPSPERSVVRAPFTPPLKSAVDPTHRSRTSLMRSAVTYLASDDPRSLPRMFVSAALG